MNDLPDVLRRLGWSEELIQTFVTRSPYPPAVADQSFLAAPITVDTTSIIVDAKAFLSAASSPPLATG
jgi:hypothetical protein